MRTAKAWVAAIGTIVVALTTAFADDVLNTEEIGTVVSTVVVAVLAVVAVYAVPNDPQA